ncbi:MAG TPA: pilus assembly PilX N-terminal domain-containing protein [Thermoanaerobaculia bacterium]|nr:pilus assembly PilX N-terminal domain-containing protein [Thermoanaerobaculia bacterium]
MTMKSKSLAAKREKERGAALVVAILVLAILTVIGIALMLITSTETRIAANEWSVNRGFYSSDAGVRWGTTQLNVALPTFLQRPEFGTKAAPLFDGSVLFLMPSHRFVTGTGFFGTDDIQVRVTTPGRISRRLCFGCKGNAPGDEAQYYYGFELRATGAQNDAFLQYSKALVADVEAGPLPGRLPF